MSAAVERTLPPTSAQCRGLSTAALIRVALGLVDIEPAKLARLLNVAPDELERARRAPSTLPLNARLTLAVLAGVRPSLAGLARELRRRTLAAGAIGGRAEHAPTTHREE